jgi:hypothetical protein
MKGLSPRYAGGIVKEAMKRRPFDRAGRREARLRETIREQAQEKARRRRPLGIRPRQRREEREMEGAAEDRGSDRRPPSRQIPGAQFQAFPREARGG